MNKNTNKVAEITNALNDIINKAKEADREHAEYERILDARFSRKMKEAVENVRRKGCP